METFHDDYKAVLAQIQDDIICAKSLVFHEKGWVFGTLYLYPNSCQHSMGTVEREMQKKAFRLSKFFIPSTRSSDSFSQVALSLGILPNDPPVKPPILVYWTRPPDNWVALNTDGAACNNHAAGGGIVRYRRGVHLANFFTYYGNGTNNEAESRAILEGISLCKSLGYCNILILTDSNLCFKWFSKVFKIPWPLRVWWKKIWDIAASCQVTIEHTYREGNYAADHLASLGIKHRGDGAANCQVDNKFKQILVGDSLNIPNIRFRQ
ncbi:hypothetical protein FRX31_007220 [Thalictrum thalictroides]|uniref:RNase H type-1 domain-containing protein n=1 Tax=Thalictrum thalictroides TaxID=46969 RepID=A0A7J6X292_THATH|nr:hypothetical protein FRX31_007220 [Thalictrum thalictroides]